MQSNDDTAPAAAPASEAPPAAGKAPPAPPPPAAKAPKQDRETVSVPVKRIVFVVVTDVPGKSAAESLQAEPRAKLINEEGKRIATTPGHLIDYLPGFRHFRITFYPPGNKPAEVAFVQESRVRVWHPVQP
jgi:hypothetical protein